MSSYGTKENPTTRAGLPKDRAKGNEPSVDTQHIGFHFKKRASGHYQVWLHTGHLIGEVQKYEKRYNLRRMYVDRGWRARDTDGRTVGEFNTRREAAESLVF